MQALQWIVRKGQGLSGLDDWRRLEYVTREMSVVSPEDPVLTLGLC